MFFNLSQNETFPNANKFFKNKRTKVNRNLKLEPRNRQPDSSQMQPKNQQNRSKDSSMCQGNENPQNANRNKRDRELKMQCAEQACQKKQD
jgi:hypothetical protein